MSNLVNDSGTEVPTYFLIEKYALFTVIVHLLVQLVTSQLLASTVCATAKISSYAATYFLLTFRFSLYFSPLAA